ncbi:uncharacterized protein ACA1_149080 [Acanthamoeba castellanii str. Neff]|uniref:Uncharacterized protein n=1 Tax=Acanthamoeba castellanii (strain ATCC 30010 / Neff) TaxID=1257118 RepID=L8HEB6_ACACF|nr:uncharacterized protein ACA1_149080 [Acanthamoeba castellanii str. Neff]ELR22741.1 hypothetical protein ACA1_149080 [Acanthamoeba castellanii str. Neff]
MQPQCLLKAQVVADGTAMVTDPMGRKLYYLVNGMVCRSELDGSCPAVYACMRPATTISSFALNVKQRLIFYSEGNRPGCNIRRARCVPEVTGAGLLLSPHSAALPSGVARLRSGPRVLYQLECPGTSSTLLASFYTRPATQDALLEQFVRQDAPPLSALWPGVLHLTCFDLHLNPHPRLIAIAVDAPRCQLYAIAKPSYTVYVNASAFWVDSALGLFYWTERLRLDTRVAHLDFLDHLATVLLVPLANSKTVLVDDLRGWIYWSDASQGRCFWIGEYYKMTQTRLQAVEPVTGDLIVLAYDASVPDVRVKRRSLATGEVSVLLSVRLGIFGPLSGLGAAQLDPRAGVEANRADQGFIATACTG